ncbi:hypothetical protein SAMN04487917_109114 [Arthrobacter sp. yr096]|nr:hypothetical protein SAMN04487912_107113 [Arthrobacter sp. cf158]SEJ67956.1 hypothetical protein SAMN04487917_109114 [Arthrobacter sp. yr096]
MPFSATNLALMSDGGEQAGYFDERTESLKNVAWAIRGETEKITPYVPLGPTDLQEALLEGTSNASG